MARPEEDCAVDCPYCGETFAVRVDRFAGRRQAFTYDCEVCCQPIAVRVRVGDDGVIELDAEREA